MNKDLRNALVNGDLAKFQRLVEEEGINPHGGGRRHMPLNLASQKGRLDIVKYLIETGKANVSETNSYGNTPLHCACYNGCFDIVKYLIETGKANVNEKNNNGNTPLHRAVSNRSLSIVKCLIETGNANVNEKNDYGDTPLYYAMFHHFDFVKYLIETGKVNVNEKDDAGGTLLHRAIYTERFDIVKYLIEQCRLRVNEKNNDGDTPLHIAISYGHFNIVKYLIETGNANVNEKSNKGDTPLHRAISNRCFDTLVPYLVEQSPESIKERNNHGDVPLQAALDRDVPLKDLESLVDRRFPLHFAVSYKRTFRFIKAYVQANPNSIQQKDKDGDLPLHAALAHNGMEMEAIDYLIQLWPDSIKQRDGSGNLPLHIAFHHAQPATPNHTGNHAKRQKMDVEATGSPLEIIQYLVELWPDSLEKRDAEGFVAALSAGKSDVEVPVIFFLIKKGQEAFIAAIINARAREEHGRRHCSTPS